MHMLYTYLFLWKIYFDNFSEILKNVNKNCSCILQYYSPWK